MGYQAILVHFKILRAKVLIAKSVSPSETRRLQLVWITFAESFPVVADSSGVSIVEGSDSVGFRLHKFAMHKKGLPPLEERFEFFGDGMPAADRSLLSSSIHEVEERHTGTPFNLKLWQKTSTAADDDLRELWRHEMRQVQRIGAYEGAREVIVEVVDIVEDETSFGIVLR